MHKDLERYKIHEYSWDNYEDLCEQIEWNIPDEFNLATQICTKWAREDGHHLAAYIEQNDKSNSYTFQQIEYISNQFANYLQEENIGKGDKVAVNGRQKIETLISHFAAWKLGAITVPLSSLLGPDGLEYRIKDSQAKVMVADSDNIKALDEINSKLPSLEEIISVSGAKIDTGVSIEYSNFWEAIRSHKRNFESVLTSPEDSAIIIYTSGTTGEPKGVVHAHRHILGLIPAAIFSARNMSIKADDVIRTPAEWSWAGSLCDILLPNLYLGTPCVGYPRESFDPLKEYDIIDKYNVTYLNCVPSAFRMMMAEDLETFDLSSVRVIGLGGEEVGDQLIKWLRETFSNAVIHPGYGQSEAPWLTSYSTAAGIEYKTGSGNAMGLPIPGHEVGIIDDDGNEINESGKIGELVIKYKNNPSCFKEYHNKPEDTKDKFLGEWMLSEDLVSRNENGIYFFHSRKDDVILSSGYRIGPGEIEDYLTKIDYIVEAAVIGVPDEERGKVPMAYIVLDQENKSKEDLKNEITQYVKSNLAKYKYPKHIEFIDSIPKTTTGKKKRSDLIKRYNDSK